MARIGPRPPKPHFDPTDPRFRSDWTDRFEAYHRKDQRPYQVFCMYTMQLIEAGRVRFSHTTIMERIRWDTLIRFHGEHFKVNQNYGKPMALLFIKEHPEHGCPFEFRERGDIGPCYDQRLMQGELEDWRL